MTHVWYDDGAANQHQIVDSYSGPRASSIGQLVPADPEFGPDFPTLVKKHPYELSLPDPYHAAWDIGSIVKYEGDRDFRGLHGCL